MSDNEDYDSDAPEEFTADQGFQLNEQLTKVQKASKDRAVHESKERRRLWAQKRTPKQAKNVKMARKDSEIEIPKESSGKAGMLPDDIVQLLAAREKKVFLSDSEGDEKSEAKIASKKKRKPKISGVETVVLNEIPLAQCALNSVEFLKKRKMQAPRSSAVLKNSSQALRLLSSSGLLK